jgi:hypothetical protein
MLARCAIQLGLLAIVALPASAQIPPRRTSAPPAAASQASRALVATATVTGGVTPAESVAFSSALRERVARLLGSRVQVVSRDGMNAALEQFGYTRDGLLPSDEVAVLAKALKAGRVVELILSKDAAGHYTAVGTIDGTRVTGTAAPGQAADQFGEAFAEQVRTAL